MKTWLKSLIRNLLFGKKHPANFPAVRIPVNQVIEKFFLKVGNNQVDITESQCIVCHNPFCIAVWLGEVNAFSSLDEGLEGLIIHENILCAKFYFQSVTRVESGTNHIAILKVRDAETYQLNRTRQMILRRYFKNKNSWLEDKSYAAAYSYPRRVIIISFRDKDYYNIFPMDFQCFIPGGNTYILGLRSTNITLDKIIAEKRIVVNDTDSAELKTVYELGNHHSKNPPPLDHLSFETTESKLFKFPVPNFSSSYKEIEIIESKKIGTHTLLIGRILNSVELRKMKSSLYHIHYFQSLITNYTTV